jgi:hypothetical protein
MVDMRQKYNLSQKYNFFMFHRKKTYLKSKSFDFFLDSCQLLYVGNLSMKKKSKKFIISHLLAFEVKQSCLKKMFAGRRRQLWTILAHFN